MKNKKNMNTKTSQKSGSKTTATKSVKKASTAKSNTTSARSSKSTTTKASRNSKPSNTRANSRPSSKATPKKSPSQREVVLNHLVSKGSINTHEAITKYGIYRLSSIIHNLNSNGGQNITSGKYEFKNKLGNKTVVAKYTLN